MQKQNQIDKLEYMLDEKGNKLELQKLCWVNGIRSREHPDISLLWLGIWMTNFVCVGSEGGGRNTKRIGISLLIEHNTSFIEFVDCLLMGKISVGICSFSYSLSQ